MQFEIGFWLAVALVGIAGVALFKVAAGTALGASVPGMRELAAFL
jgi:hypothetical protein